MEYGEHGAAFLNSKFAKIDLVRKETAVAAFSMKKGQTEAGFQSHAEQYCPSGIQSGDALCLCSGRRAAATQGETLESDR
jgi:hypothetical protein